MESAEEEAAATSSDTEEEDEEDEWSESSRYVRELGCHATLGDKTPNESMGCRVGAVVRALAFHQCVPGSIPGPGVICELSLLVLYSAPTGFSPGTAVFPSPQKPTCNLI